jgi:hypothetical protein
MRLLVSETPPQGPTRRPLISHPGSPNDTDAPTRSFLRNWISRADLALELGVSTDTLRRWETMRFGPPCVRAGRKVFYRRTTVQDWLIDQEHAAPRRRRAGGWR